MDKNEHERFAQAVERKKAEAKEASEHPPKPAEADNRVQDAEQSSLVDRAHTQDDRDPRAKSSRHKKHVPDVSSNR